MGLGAGEFGRAMQVRYMNPGCGDDAFAVKKLKPFEGVKYR